MSRTARFVLALLPSFLAVAWIAFDAERVLRTGAEARLAVLEPKLVQDGSGRYVALPLAIARVSAAEVAVAPGLAIGDTVWVRLERAEPAWRAVEVRDVAFSEPGVVAARATVARAEGETLVLRCDVERFYLLDRGRDPTDPPGAHVLTAVVRVAPSGATGLADLLVDGEPWKDWNARSAR